MKSVFLRWPLVLGLIAPLVIAGCITGDGPDEVMEQGGPKDGVDPGSDNETSALILEADLGWTTGTAGCTTLGGLYLFADAAQGIDHDATPIKQEAHGEGFNATITSTHPIMEWGAAFWDGEELADTFATSDDALDGTVPDPSDTVIFWSCGGAEVEVTLTVKKD